MYGSLSLWLQGEGMGKDNCYWAVYKQWQGFRSTAQDIPCHKTEKLILTKGIPMYTPEYLSPMMRAS